MRLVWHLVRHDLASLRPFAWAWAGVLLVQTLVLWMGPPVPDGLAGPPMSLDIAAWVMRLALTVVFVSALVLRHPVVGTTAFWLTRPVQRADRFAAVLLSLGVVTVYVPFVWSLGTFGLLGFGIPHAAAGALRIAAEQLAFAMGALLLAALTRNLAQSVVAALALAAAYGLGRGAMSMVPYQPLPFGLVMRQSEWTTPVSLIAAAVVLLVLAAHQYVTLQTRRSSLLVAGVIVLSLLNARFPVVRPAAGREIPAAPAALETPPVAFDRSSVRTGTVTRMARGTTTVHVSQSARLDGAGPAGAIILRPMAVQSRLRFVDGTITNWDSSQFTPWVDASPEPGAAQQPWASMARALDTPDLVPPRDAPGERFRTTFLEVTPDHYAARQSLPATLLMNVTFEAYQYDTFARAPLAPGSRASAPGYLIEIEGTAPAEDGVAVLVREVRVPNPFAPAPVYYALVNRERRQAVVSAKLATERFRSALGDSRAPIVARHLVTFEPARADLIDAGWMARAELVVLQPRSLGRVIRGVHEAEYVLGPPQGR